MSEWQCGVQTPRMKGPCVLWKHHAASPWIESKVHRSRSPVNENTPRLTQFAHIVNTALDHGVQLSYVEIGELMDHPNPRSVAQYGLGSRYTKLRQKIYRERGIVPDGHRRSVEQSAKIVAEMKGVL